MKIKQVKQLDYEFECEALADYQYATQKADLLKDNVPLESLKPAQFATGKTMYAQVRDNYKLTQQPLPKK